MAHILLATIGSLGDLHPFIAIALELRARGHAVTLAVPADHVARVEALGLVAAVIQPPFATIAADLGMDPSALGERTMRDPQFLFDRLLVPAFAQTLAPLSTVAKAADVIVAAPFLPAAAAVAEDRGIPRVNLLLQPMTLFSRHDPPQAPGFGAFSGLGAGPVARRWNALGYGAIRQVLRWRHQRTLAAVRRAHGLAPSRDVMLFDAARGAAATLCCWSPLFAPLPPDAPQGAVASGFVRFDGGQPLPAGLAAFLRAGPPPLVFTLGSFAVHVPGDFYVVARRIAERLGRRAVLLTGEAAVSNDGRVYRCGYAPHSAVFPHAAAIVHHGGAGTTGQALQAGRRQLIVPHLGDQYDNGVRLAGIGVGRVVAATDFAAQGAAALADLLADRAVTERAATLGERIGREQGAQAAATVIERIAD